MTMVDETGIESAESQAPMSDDDRGFREALAEKLERMDTEPVEASEPAAPREPAPETRTAAEPAPERDTPSQQAIDYATLRAPELRQHLTAREQELQAAKDARSKAETRLKDLESKDSEYTQRESEAIASLGDDTEYSALARKVTAARDLDQDPSYYLTDDEMRTFDRLTAQRKHAASLMGVAATRVFERNIAEAKERVETHGLDPKVVALNPGTGALIDHAVEVTMKKVTESFKDQLAEKDATIASLQTQVVGRNSKSPSVGGRSSGDGKAARGPSSGDDAMDDIKEGRRDQARQNRGRSAAYL